MIDFLGQIKILLLNKLFKILGLLEIFVQNSRVFSLNCQTLDFSRFFGNPIKRMT